MRFSLPTKKQVLKGTLGVLGAIIIGALGSGVWQSLLGPALHVSTRWVLDIASLGLTSYKNRVYSQIAADNQSAVAFYAYITLWGVHAMMGTMVALGGFYWASGHRRRAEQALKGLSDAPPNLEPEISNDALRQELVGFLKSMGILRLLLYLLLLLISFGVVYDLVSYARLSYVNSADAHYHQVMRVASPYLDAREQVEAESDFAQIGSREDYVRLLSRLEGQCKAHGRTVPKFDPW